MSNPTSNPICGLNAETLTAIGARNKAVRAAKKAASIKTSVTTDDEGCIIATARCGARVCHYDGAHYDGNGDRDEMLRDAAHRAQTRAFHAAK